MWSVRSMAGLANDVVAAIMAALERFAADAEPADDITLLAVRRSPA